MGPSRHGIWLKRVVRQASAHPLVPWARIPTCSGKAGERKGRGRGRGGGGGREAPSPHVKAGPVGRLLRQQHRFRRLPPATYATEMKRWGLQRIRGFAASASNCCNRAHKQWPIKKVNAATDRNSSGGRTQSLEPAGEARTSSVCRV